MLAASTAFLNLSTYLDPFPTVNLESMALGVPVIGTRLGGTPEAVVDGETGFLVNPFDVADVAAKALALIEDDGLRERLGEERPAAGRGVLHRRADGGALRGDLPVPVTGCGRCR